MELGLRKSLKILAPGSSLRRRVAYSLAIVRLVLVPVIFLAVYYLFEMGLIVDRIVNVDAPVATLAEQASVQMLDARRAERSYFLLRDEEFLQANRESLNQLRNIFRKIRQLAPDQKVLQVASELEARGWDRVERDHIEARRLREAVDNAASGNYQIDSLSGGMGAKHRIGPDPFVEYLDQFRTPTPSCETLGGPNNACKADVVSSIRRGSFRNQFFRDTFSGPLVYEYTQKPKLPCRPQDSKNRRLRRRPQAASEKRPDRQACLGLIHYIVQRYNETCQAVLVQPSR